MQTRVIVVCTTQIFIAPNVTMHENKFIERLALSDSHKFDKCTPN